MAWCHTQGPKYKLRTGLPHPAMLSSLLWSAAGLSLWERWLCTTPLHPETPPAMARQHSSQCPLSSELPARTSPLLLGVSSATAPPGHQIWSTCKSLALSFQVWLFCPRNPERCYRTAAVLVSHCSPDPKCAARADQHLSNDLTSPPLI